MIYIGTPGLHEHEDPRGSTKKPRSDRSLLQSQSIVSASFEDSALFREPWLHVSSSLIPFSQALAVNQGTSSCQSGLVSSFIGSRKQFATWEFSKSTASQT